MQGIVWETVIYTRSSGKLSENVTADINNYKTKLNVILNEKTVGKIETKKSSQQNICSLVLFCNVGNHNLENESI